MAKAIKIATVSFENLHGKELLLGTSSSPGSGATPCCAPERRATRSAGWWPAAATARAFRKSARTSLPPPLRARQQAALKYGPTTGACPAIWVVTTVPQ